MTPQICFACPFWWTSSSRPAGSLLYALTRSDHTMSNYVVVSFVLQNSLVAKVYYDTFWSDLIGFPITQSICPLPGPQWAHLAGFFRLALSPSGF